MRHGFQTGFGVQADRRPARGDRAARRRAAQRLQAQHAARGHRFGQDVHDGQRDRGAEQTDADHEPQQDAGGPTVRRIQEFLPRERRRVFRLLLRLLPARGLYSVDRHVYRERPVDQRRNRKNASQHELGSAQRAQRYHRRVERIVHLRYREPRGFPRHVRRTPGGRRDQPQQAVVRPRGRALHAQRGRFQARYVPRERRYGRHLRRLRGQVLPGDFLRQRNRNDLLDRPAYGPAPRGARSRDRLSGQPVRHDARAHGAGDPADSARSGHPGRITSSRSASRPRRGG